jgi:hypothetical protein
VNEYFEETSKQEMEQTFKNKSVLEFIQLGAVPKIPLQRTVGYILNSSQVATRAPNPHLGDPATSYITHENISTMVKSQRDITELMIMQQNLSLLPKREVPVFKVDPLSYQPFMHAFKYLIEDKTSSSQDRLYFLEHFTAGQARDLVRSCMHMDARRGYPEAMQLPEKHFGDEMKMQMLI